MLAIIIKRLYKEKNICNDRTGFVVKWFTNKFMHGMIKLPEWEHDVSESWSINATMTFMDVENIIAGHVW